MSVVVNESGVLWPDIVLAPPKPSLLEFGFQKSIEIAYLSCCFLSYLVSPNHLAHTDNSSLDEIRICGFIERFCSKPVLMHVRRYTTVAYEREVFSVSF